MFMQQKTVAVGRDRVSGEIKNRRLRLINGQRRGRNAEVVLALICQREGKDADGCGRTSLKLSKRNWGGVRSEKGEGRWDKKKER